MRTAQHFLNRLIGPALVLVGLLGLLGLGALQAGAQTSQEMSPAPPAAGEQQPEHEDYSERIVWFHDNPAEAVFLPQRALDETALEDLPVSEHARDRIRYALRFPEDRRRNAFRNECLYEPDLGGPVRDEARMTVEELIASRSLAFVGTVVDTVPGWSAWQGRPVTMVYVRIEEILRNDDDGGDGSDGDGFLRVGHTVAYSRSHATIDLDGVEACSKLPDEVELPGVGERVLVTGSRFEQHPLFLVGHYVFPVRDGLIQPLRWTRRIRDVEPRSLELIRKSIRPEGDR
ncbi:MAG: hypothetical protein PVG07_11250 [Acidobacteriota bacterium]|jgi:hypothetical protein